MTVRHSQRRIVILASLLLILFLFLFRPGIYRLRNRIAVSIGSALGRRVAIENVRLRLLPRPGFDLEGLVIYDDPAFGEEPMIRAQEVSAAIRLRSLLRGRLEIAQLSANEPSINLVRNQQGRWNLSSLLERNAQIPAAPTQKKASERRPAFPYLEAGHARVNFKIGQTKKSYALVDADVALWQDSENSWGARIKAEPIRTDLNLTDTGLLQVNASWQRSANLQSTPVQINAQWRYGQLGQITKLMSGNDRGWRGGINVTAQMSGTPEALHITSQAVIDDFHRYDIANTESVRLATACSGKYNAAMGSLTDLLCQSPVGEGMVQLRGSLSSSVENGNYDLKLGVEKVPLVALIRLLRQAKKDLPADLTGTGSLSGEFRAIRNVDRNADRKVDRNADQSASSTSGSQWSGTGQATGVRLTLNRGSSEIKFETIPLALTLAKSGIGEGERIGHPNTDAPKKKERAGISSERYVRIGPVSMTMNSSAPVTTGGWISGAGYRILLLGDMDVKDLFRLETALALPVTRPVAEGSAKLDVSVSGVWRDFGPPVTTGTAQLHNVRAALRGFNAPIEINSATMTLTPEMVFVEKLFAHTGNTHWSGEVKAPRHCSATGASGSLIPDPNCVVEFDLTADRLSTADLADWLAPHPAKRPWYLILNSKSGADSASDTTLNPSRLRALQAKGTLHIGHFDLRNMPVTQITTKLELDRGKISLNTLRAQLLQGTHQGTWMIDASKPVQESSTQNVSASDLKQTSVRYHGEGTLKDISLAQLSKVMGDDWITGTAEGSFDLAGGAESFQELVEHSDGNLDFVMRNGGLPHVEIPGSISALPVHRFAGNLKLTKGVWALSEARLESRDGFYLVSGTASASNGFDFVLKRGDEQSWTVTGPLAKPQVSPGNRTVASGTVAKEIDTGSKPAKP